MGTTLAVNLRARARALQLTHNEVASRAGLGERRFANYVLGRREPDLQTLVRIARALQTSPNDLLGFDTPQVANTVELLRARMSAALDQLDERDLEVVVRQAEVMARVPLKKPG